MKDMQTWPEAFQFECVCVCDGECVWEKKKERGWEKRQVRRRVNVCLLAIACCIHLSANPAKSVYLGIWSKPVGPQCGEGGKNVKAGAGDVAMPCMTLEKDVVIVYRPSPSGRWLVRSCRVRTAQKLSICTHCGAFSHGVSTWTLTSSVNIHRAGGAQITCSHILLSLLPETGVIYPGRHHN